MDDICIPNPLRILALLPAELASVIHLSLLYTTYVFLFVLAVAAISLLGTYICAPATGLILSSISEDAAKDFGARVVMSSILTFSVIFIMTAIVNNESLGMASWLRGVVASLVMLSILNGLLKVVLLLVGWHRRGSSIGKTPGEMGV